MNKTIIFDLDGTLIDTSEGIYNSVKYTVKKLNLPQLPEERYSEFIGPPPQESYRKFFGLSYELSQKATEFHRQYAFEYGTYESKVFEGMPQLLERLKEEGYVLAVATYKRNDLAWLILQHYDLAKYFDSINGCDDRNKLTKAEIIEICMSELGISDKSKIILVGDSEYDAIAANAVGIPFIGLTYGFGFKNKEDVDKFPNIGYADSVGKLIELFIK